MPENDARMDTGTGHDESRLPDLHYAQDNPPISISAEDIHLANQLSEHCPICVSAVEKNLADVALKPVICVDCGTLYHRACWDGSGGTCAVLGCGSKRYRIFGEDLGPRLTISEADIARAARTRAASNGRTKRLKEREQSRTGRTRPQLSPAGQPQSFWRSLFQRILRAFS